MQEGRVIMDKISPRMMRALQKTGEHISGYIDRKDMIAFQNAQSDSYIKQEKSISVTPVYYIRLDDGRYIVIRRDHLKKVVFFACKVCCC